MVWFGVVWFEVATRVLPELMLPVPGVGGLGVVISYEASSSLSVLPDTLNTKFIYVEGKENEEGARYLKFC